MFFTGLVEPKPGTTVKFKPTVGQDSMPLGANIRLQCISAMKEYENKSLEVFLHVESSLVL